MSSPSRELRTISVGKAGAHLAYLDSGAPMAGEYTTIFTVHGLAFSSYVFTKILDIAPAHGIRVVCINRRDYPGSSPLSQQDIKTLEGGTDQEKADCLVDRGLEILDFIDRFAQWERLPRIQPGKTGGFALLGWSLGVSHVLAAVANAQLLDGAAQQRLLPQFKALILEDSPTMALGMPDPARAWFPPTNPGIPDDQKLAATVAWLTGHYKHGDLSSRDLGVLSYVNPGTHKAPSIYNDMHEHLHEILYAPPVRGSDILTCGLAPPLHENYMKACFSSGTKALFPEMKITAIAHGETVSFCIAPLWEMQADSERYGEERIQFDVIPHTNHFMLWETPEFALEVYKRAL